MILGLLIGLLVGLALGAVAGAGLEQHLHPDVDRTPPGPTVHVLEDHPPACVCGGTGKTDAGTDCPMLWRRPQAKVELRGRLPRGSQR